MINFAPLARGDGEHLLPSDEETEIDRDRLICDPEYRDDIHALINVWRRRGETAGR